MSSNKKQDRDRTPKTESERKRLARSMETPEDAALRLQKQRAYQASLRADETEEEATQRVEKQRAFKLPSELMRLRKRLLSVLRNSVLIKLPSEQMRLRKRLLSVLRNSELIKLPSELMRLRKRLLSVEKQRAYQASLRVDETEEEATQRVEKQRAYQASLRVDETEEEATQRRELDNSLKSLHRSNLTETGRVVRSKRQMAINAVSKVARNKKYLNFARSEITSEVNDSIIPEHSMGTMSYICSRCDARFWECEKLSTSTKASIKFSLCCGGGGKLFFHL